MSVSAVNSQGLAVVAARPIVRLVAHTAQPYRLAVASARTCYAADFVLAHRLGPKGERIRVTLEDALPGRHDELAELGRLDTPEDRRVELIAALQVDVDEDTSAAVASFAQQARNWATAEDRIAKSIYEAGHHTPFQHPTFVFALEDVSRNVVESFLHNHTFYNSEQQSQRYVEMGDARVHVPASVADNPAARAAYDGAIAVAWEAYHDLRSRLVDSNLRVMSAIGRIKGQSDKQIRAEAEKKSQEMARYVIPVAATTKLYHTVSAVVLLRYARMCEATNVGGEARMVVDAMLSEVAAIDPVFAQQIHEAPRPAGDHMENRLSGNRRAPADAGDARLLASSGDASLVAEAIREVTGSELADEELLSMALDPARNDVWNDTLNTWDHSPVLRALRHVHLTFAKRLSLTAHAQDQRHRMTPASRPLLDRILGAEPDVYTPDIIAADAAALATYQQAIDALWQTARALRDEHAIPAHDATYLLPNAANIHFTQSGDLLSFIHKWRLRLCFNAQKEIFDASLEELRQAQAVMPELTRYIGPPCSFVAARQPADLQDSVEACCPEGPRWCGVKVWKNFDAAKGKPKRPY